MNERTTNNMRREKEENECRKERLTDESIDLYLSVGNFDHKWTQK